MINKNLLKAKVAIAGMNFKELAKAIKMPYQNLTNRKAGRNEFNAKEIKAIKEVLKLTDSEVSEIFLF